MYNCGANLDSYSSSRKPWFDAVSEFSLPIPSDSKISKELEELRLNQTLLTKKGNNSILLFKTVIYIVISISITKISF